MDNITQKILNYKEQLEEAKNEKNREEGKISTLESRLKKEFECSNIKEAEEKIEELDEDIIKKDKELNKIINKIEEDYDWE